MADFCKQCSIEIFCEDYRELAGISDRMGQVLEEGCGWGVLCEGCGHTIVDNDGKCINQVCKKHGFTPSLNATDKVVDEANG